ncbi:MAG: type II secretion system F family protein [Bacteroidales bacterium]|nr:type II secretion system F family protein [Bacteroidales bacterium]
MFTSRLPVRTILAWIRALKQGTDIGLALDRIFRQLARTGRTRQRDLAHTLAERLCQGETLTDALKAHRRQFPPLLIEMIAVGEKTGRLTEVLEELERYFEAVRDTRTQFQRAMVWPVFLYLSGIGVMTLMLLILGLIAPADGKGFDPLGLGLLGPGGAFAFLLTAGMFTVTVLGAFLYVQGNDALRAQLEARTLTIPGLGSCFQAFALHRFCLGWHMTSEAGMRADRSLKLAFRITTNAAYIQQADRVAQEARSGRAIPEILEGCGPILFPREFLETVEVGEVSGQLTEVMAKQAAFYREESTRKLKTLAQIASGAIYTLIGFMVLFVILRIVLSIAGVYQGALQGV